MQTWNGRGSATDGDFVAAADVTFTIDLDSKSGEEMVNVAEAKAPRRQGASFLSSVVFSLSLFA